MLHAFSKRKHLYSPVTLLKQTCTAPSMSLHIDFNACVLLCLRECAAQASGMLFLFVGFVCFFVFPAIFMLKCQQPQIILELNMRLQKFIVRR